MERTEQPGDGFTVDYLTDGTIVVTYDGTCGVRYLTVLDGDAPAVLRQCLRASGP